MNIGYLNKETQSGKNYLSGQNVIHTGDSHGEFDGNNVTVSVDGKFAFNVGLIDHNSTESPSKKRRVKEFVASDFSSLSLDSTSFYCRSHIGGKGLHLAIMQSMKLTVPEFRCVDTQILKTIETIPFNKEQLEKHIPPIPEFVSHDLLSIKEYLFALSLKDDKKRVDILNGLSEFIASEYFYNQITKYEVASQIRKLYQELTFNFTRTRPIIVRSSSVVEDDYGNAQAGKYLSEVHDGQDIVKTCLKVLASGYNPNSCYGNPEDMAILLQECVSCLYGGVVMSHSSLTDDTMRVEFTRGQPKGVVSGLEGVTPHCCEIERENGQIKEYRFKKGNIPCVVELHNCGAGYKEISVKGSTLNQELSIATVKALYDDITKLENRLNCPVDVEFGVDKYNQLVLFQARPITSLTGGLNFSMSIPENALIKGTLVSDGICMGAIITSKDELLKSRNSIIFAQRCENWMLESKYLDLAGGFVFKYGGVNDHVAITILGKGKPYMLANEAIFEDIIKSHKVVTLCCGTFNGVRGGCLLAGSQQEILNAHMDAQFKIDFNNLVEQQEYFQLPSIDFTRPDDGFKWLNNQNYRLLDYFASHRLLHLCLSPVGSKQLSMSPQRDGILRALGQEVENLILYSERFIEGYKCFSFLAGEKSVLGNSKLEKMIMDIPQCHDEIKKMEQWLDNFQSNIESIVKIVIKARASGIVAPVVENNFNLWLASCQELQVILQKLIMPDSVAGIKSIHDIVFFIHKRFIQMLPVIAEHSGFGVVTKVEGPNKKITFIDFVSLQKSGNSLLNSECKKELVNVHRIFNMKVISMEDCLLVLAEMGNHACTVEMLEQAENGKDRTLRLRYTDKYGSHGSWLRAWFLLQMIKNIPEDICLPICDISFDEVTQILTVEYTHIKTKKAMQVHFIKLISIVFSVQHLNLELNKKKYHISVKRFDSATLKSAVDSTSVLNTNKSDFNKILFLTRYFNQFSDEQDVVGICNRDYLNNECFCLDRIAKYLKMADSEKVIVYIISDIGKHEKTDLLYAFLIADPCKAAFYIKDNTDWLNNECEAAKYLHHNGLIMEFLSEDLKNNIFIILLALKQNPEALKYINKDKFEDREFILYLISQGIDCFQYVIDKFKNDLEIINVALTHHAYIFKHLNPKLRANNKIARLAILSGCNSIELISKELQNDRKFAEEIIEIYPVFFLNFTSFRNDRVLFKMALLKYQQLVFSCPPIFLKDKEVAKISVNQEGTYLECFDEELRDDEEIVTIAYNNDPTSLEYASSRLQNDKKFLMYLKNQKPRL